MLLSDLILQSLLTKLCPILSKVWNSLRVWSPCAFPADMTWLKRHPARCGFRTCFFSNDPLHYRKWWPPSAFSLSDSFLTCSWQIFCIHACFSDHISHLYTLLKNISSQQPASCTKIVNLFGCPLLFSSLLPLGPQPLLWTIHNFSIRISFWELSPASFWTLRPGETKGSKSSFYNFLRYFKTQTNWVCLVVTTSLWNFLMARWPTSRIPVTSDFPCRASELARIRSRVLILSLLKDEIIMWVSDFQPCCTLESLGGRDI